MTGASLTVRCLLVDDRDENLLALSALLRRDDVEVLTARSGVEALELLLAHDIALALLDVQMPQMDGFELAELIRGSERTRHVPLIFVTAGARDQHRLFRGYETGAVDFLYKPIDPHILRNKADVFFELHRQKRLLAEELKARSDTLRLYELFVGMLGHDLRNPLTAILTSASLLQRRSADPHVQQSAQRTLDSGRRMSRMIGTLLDLTRVRLAGGIALTLSTVDLAPVLHGCVQDCQSASGREIEFQVDGDAVGDWDADRIAQVATNLIGNALHHGDSTEPVRVRLDGRAANELVLRFVNGGRIDPAVLPRLFDPFWRGDGERTPGEGLGLGLYIVRQIVAAHRGSIEVGDTADKHSTSFTVRLPRRPA